MWIQFLLILLWTVLMTTVSYAAFVGPTGHWIAGVVFGLIALFTWACLAAQVSIILRTFKD